MSPTGTVFVLKNRLHTNKKVLVTIKKKVHSSAASLVSRWWCVCLYNVCVVQRWSIIYRSNKYGWLYVCERCFNVILFIGMMGVFIFNEDWRWFQVNLLVFKHFFFCVFIMFVLFIFFSFLIPNKLYSFWSFFCTLLCLIKELCEVQILGESNVWVLIRQVSTCCFFWDFMALDKIEGEDLWSMMSYRKS